MSLEGLDWLKERSLTEERLHKVRQLKKLSEELGTSLPKFAVAWCLKNPNVSSVILGASKAPQLEETLTSLDVLPLITSEIEKKVEEILGNKPKMPAF